MEFTFRPPLGYFPVELDHAEPVLEAFVETFRNDTDLTEHDRELLLDGVAVLEAQFNAAREAGAAYFGYGLRTDPNAETTIAESYLIAYVREFDGGNPRSVLAGFAQAAVREAAVKSVTRQEFPDGPAIIAEYERVLPAITMEPVPTNELMTVRQIRAAFSFPAGHGIVILELSSRHTKAWEKYRDELLAAARSVRFDPISRPPG